MKVAIGTAPSLCASCRSRTAADRDGRSMTFPLHNGWCIGKQVFGDRPGGTPKFKAMADEGQRKSISTKAIPALPGPHPPRGAIEAGGPDPRYRRDQGLLGRAAGYVVTLSDLRHHREHGGRDGR